MMPTPRRLVNYASLFYNFKFESNCEQEYKYYSGVTVDSGILIVMFLNKGKHLCNYTHKSKNAIEERKKRYPKKDEGIHVCTRLEI